MRITHIVTVIDDEFSLGGPLTVALQHCRALQNLGHDVVLVGGWAGSGRAPREVEGVPAKLFRVVSLIPPLRFSGLFAPLLPWWLLRHRRRIDVAHVHFARDLVPLSAAGVLRVGRVAFVTQTHGMVVADHRRVSRWIDRLATVPLLRRARTRFVLTEREQADLAEVTGAAMPMTTLPNGADTAGHLRSEPPEPDVLFLARLHPRKRVMVFARAAVELVGAETRSRFSVVGPDDGDACELRQFIDDEPALDGHLVYEGALTHSDAVDRIARASVYVLPSVDEPFPMSVLEALSLGVPVVVTESNGLSATLAEAGAALIVPDDDSVALAVAIDRVLTEPALAADLQARGQAVATDTYGMRAVALRLEAEYRRAIEGGST